MDGWMWWRRSGAERTLLELGNVLSHRQLGVSKLKEGVENALDHSVG
jgi:hypothetical protein